MTHSPEVMAMARDEHDAIYRAVLKSVRVRKVLPRPKPPALEKDDG